MSTIKVAVGTDDDVNLATEHFGSAKKYLIYELSGRDEVPKLVEEIENATVDENRHGDPKKAKGILGLLKGVDAFLGLEMGPNIVRIRKKVVPIISEEKNVMSAVKLLSTKFDLLEKEVSVPEGENKTVIKLNLKDQDLMSILATAMHPEINNSLVELGMIGAIEENAQGYKIELKIPLLGIPEVVKDMLITSIKDALKQNKITRPTEIELVVMSEEERSKFMELSQKNWREKSLL